MTDNNLQNIMILMAGIMPKELIIERIEESIKEYKEACLLNNQKRKDETWIHLALSCVLAISKTSGADPFKQIEFLNEVDQALKLLKPNQG